MISVMPKFLYQSLSICACAALLFACEQNADQSNSSTFVATDVSLHFVGSQVCANCHQQQFDEWQQSHHFQSMRNANQESVLADFNEIEEIVHDVNYRFYTNDEQENLSYWVMVQEPNEPEQHFEISYTFGYTPLQQYMVELEDGHVQVLNMAWDSRPQSEGGQNWFHLRPDEVMSTDNIFHWRRHYQNWNGRCADCHSTGLEKNYDVANHSFDTQWAEINVACEACHGQGSQHVELAQQQGLDSGNTGFITSTQRSLGWSFSQGQAIASPIATESTQSNEIDMCGRCHSLRSSLAEHVDGESYHDEVRLQIVDEINYFADGQILEETFVLGSFLQSKMHANGVTCANCHNPHTGSVLVEGNGLCLQCHTATRYETVTHHEHTMGTQGAECVSCHMPARTYMQIDARRDHSFVVPNAMVSASLGVPNPCLSCHQNETADWLEANLPINNNNLAEGHWALAKDAFLKGESNLDDLSAYLQPTESAMKSATILTTLSSQPSQQSFDIAKQQLTNADPLIRRAALASMANMPSAVRVSSALDLIGDEVRSVRLEALTLLLPDYQVLAESQRQLASNALEEYRESLALSADSPEGQLSLASLLIALEDYPSAEAAFQHALRIEPNYVPSLINFADFYRASNRDELGGELLARALELEPQNSSANFAYAMSLIRAQQKDAAMGYLQTASEQADSSPYYHYVYAVGLNDLGQTEQALSIINQALQQWPNDAGLLELSGQLQ